MVYNDEISLLNVSLKIISKTPSEKLSKALTDLISSQQTGYVKSRQIGENGRLLSDVKEITKTKKLGTFFNYNGPWKSIWFIRS